MVAWVDLGSLEVANFHVQVCSRTFANRDNMRGRIHELLVPPFHTLQMELMPTPHVPLDAIAHHNKDTGSPAHRRHCSVVADRSPTGVQVGGSYGGQAHTHLNFH